MHSEGSRDVSHLVVPRIGRIVERPDQLPCWELQDALEEPVAPVQQFLTDLAARDLSPLTIRSYALDLLRWHRVLWQWGIAWDQATSGETRDFVLWMKQTCKNRPTPLSKHIPGAVNGKTGQQHLGDGFAARTINHNLTVVREFYQFHVEAGRGPVCNPVPQRRDRRTSERFAAHHNPLEPFPHTGRAAYRQKVPRRVPRSIPDTAIDELFGRLRSNRDRALIVCYLSSGARPSELLTMTNAMVDPGNQLIAVIRKGSRDLQWVPASPDAFVWLRLYQAELPENYCNQQAAVWWTRRKPYRPLNYLAARAVFRRANELCGTNWTLHALRHTAAIRMLDDPNMSLTDVQTVLGHAWVTSTQQYLVPRDAEVFAHAKAHFQRLRERLENPDLPSIAQVPHHSIGYGQSDLDELFGEA